MPSASRSLGRNDWRGVFRLCWSPSGAPHTPPPRPELLLLLNKTSVSTRPSSTGPTLWRAIRGRHRSRGRTRCLRCSTWRGCCSRSCQPRCCQLLLRCRLCCRCRLLSRLGLAARGDRLHDQPDLVLPCCLSQDCRVPQHTVVQGILRLGKEQ